MAGTERRSIAAFLVSALLCVAPDAGAQVRQPREHEVKAVYLLNFGRFTRWPATASEAGFVVCVVGRDPFGSTLDAAVEGERIDGRPVVTRRVAFADDLTECRIVFIDASESANLSAILHRVQGTPTLTVSDLPQFADEGGMIQFVPDGNRLRFTVNLTATERAGLMLSSELLRVALRVKAKPDAL